MTSYRLHYFPESGNSYKIALMLTLCGQTFEPIWTDFAGGVTRTAEWRSTVNEMGEIPVLEEDGQSFTQTAPILLRLAQRYGRFGGRDEQEQFEILRWLFWDNHKLTGYMATYRFQRVFTPSPNADVLRFLKHRLDDFLTILEKQLSDRSFVIGERPTVVDLSMIGYLQYPKQETGYDFAASHPAINVWLQRVGALPGWRGASNCCQGRACPAMRRLHRVVNPHFDPSPLPSNGRTMVMLTGSCLCGGVAYEVDAAVGPIAHCHCATCRKAHGSAFSSVSSVPRDKFRWTKGANLLASYESSPGKVRRFCSKCGSQIVAERAGQSTVILRLGCVDTPITDRPKAHIWRSQGASWFDPKDPLPELPEGFA